MALLLLRPRDMAQPSLRLAEACAGGRALWAVCEVAPCGARARIDPGPWLAMGLGGAALTSLEDRLRCVCGARRARLTSASSSPPQAPGPGGPYLFL
ncbi:MAG: hypothetical protein JWM33_2825 [Caulobacteraceae bacterium]|nr:hypothetical protein [Caulobacteraceae bacterium]